MEKDRICVSEKYTIEYSFLLYSSQFSEKFACKLHFTREQILISDSIHNPRNAKNSLDIIVKKKFQTNFKFNKRFLVTRSVMKSLFLYL